MAEFGVCLPRGWRSMLPQAVAALEEESSPIPGLLRTELQRQIARIKDISAQLADVERQISCWMRKERECARVAAIPGVGLLTATAAVATIGDARTFTSGRQFAAYLGLVPRHSGTGGRVQLLGISKRGDTYLRTLLIHGARGIVSRLRPEAKDSWLGKLARRRPNNVAVVALANKMARQIWALMAYQRTYEPNYAGLVTGTGG